jgi:predicted HTH transcriptional regulator
MVVSVPDGLAKPYVDHQGRIWVKQGADKRHVTAREEMQRMFQRSGLVYADGVPVAGSSPADIDEKAFTAYFQRRFGQRPEYAGQGLEQLLQNLGLSDGGELNLAGLLLFGQRPQRLRPALVVKAVCFPGTALTDTRYLDSEDIDGTLPEQYQRSFAFIRRNLRHVQGDRGFNTLGQLEIPEQALEELLVNALIHRDHFTSASIRLMVFADRLEIISPGHLPDSLSTEAIRRGATNRRNPTLTEHAVHLLPYRGLGTGIPRALRDWPAIDLIDEVAANQFRVVVRRPAAGEGAQQVTPQVTQQVTQQVGTLVRAFSGEHSRQELMDALGLRDRNHFGQAFLLPAIDRGLVEMTLPDKPNSRLQRYRLTPAGRAWQQAAAQGLPNDQT